MPRKQFALTLAGIIGFILLLGIVGKMDADDAEMQADQYCDMVYRGLWPDYQRSYHENCKNGQLVRR